MLQERDRERDLKFDLRNYRQELISKVSDKSLWQKLQVNNSPREISERDVSLNETCVSSCKTELMI